jgi:hypothetical protein
MEDFTNFFLGIIVLIVPPFLLVKYLVSSYKEVMTSDKKHSLSSTSAYHQKDSNPLTLKNRKISGKHNVFKESSSHYEVKVEDTISINELYSWLLKEGYIKRKN